MGEAEPLHLLRPDPWLLTVFRPAGRPSIHPSVCALVHPSVTCSLLTRVPEKGPSTALESFPQGHTQARRGPPRTPVEFSQSKSKQGKEN